MPCPRRACPIGSPPGSDEKDFAITDDGGCTCLPPMERAAIGQKPSGIVRPLVRGAALGLALALLVEVVRVAFGPNVHEILPGRVYRAR